MTKWEDNGENSLWLLTPDEFSRLPDGTTLECIDSTIVTKGMDYIDNDARFNHLAYGIRNPFNHPLRDLFLIFRLAQ